MTDFTEGTKNTHNKSDSWNGDSRKKKNSDNRSNGKAWIIG